MSINGMSWLVKSVVAGVLVLLCTNASSGQVTRYQPQTPTVSPYLNLFQNGRNGQLSSAVPNYYSMVRPQLQQQQTNQIQQQIIQQQGQTIGQLQGNVQTLQQKAKAGQPVVLTGHTSWFGNPGTQNRFLNTSKYYSRAGTPGQTPQVPYR